MTGSLGCQNKNVCSELIGRDNVEVKQKRTVYRQGIYVFLVLAVLTAVEFAVFRVTSGAIVPIMVLALVKAGLIVQYFMHVYRLWREESH